MLITLPNSEIYEIIDDRLELKNYAETKQFSLYKSFLNCPERFLNYLT